MASEWPVLTIEEISSRIAMGPFGSNIKTDNFVPSGVPVIRGGNLTAGRFRATEFVYLTEEKADELIAANAAPGDLIFTHRGTLGQVGLVPKGQYRRYVVSQSQMKLTCDPTKADALFLYYYFKSPAGQHSLLMNTSQTGVPAISRPVSSLKAIRLRLPGLGEQRSIAGILGALDDRIELSRRMSETLENMARALYESWVRDAGSESVSEDHIGTVGDVVEFDPPTPIRRGEERPYLGLAELPTSGPVHEPPAPRAFTSGARFRNLDTLLARITPSLENGKACIANSLPGDGMAWGSTELIVMRPRPGVPFSLPYLIARDEGFRALAIQNMTGTSGRQRVPREPLQRAPMPTPSPGVLARFGEVADPMFETIFCRAREAETLSSIRDALLPKLISGELRIPEAERLVSEVT